MAKAFDYMRHFPERMKHVGMYTSLLNASGQKGIWRDTFPEEYEQVNLIFAVLLFIMDQSLKEEDCILDDISDFINYASTTWFGRALSREECGALAFFIINDVLSNKGEPISVMGFNTEALRWESMHISYIANKIVYTQSQERRASYYMTEDGYRFLLGTLEMEDNLKLPIQSLIFSMHLERQSYDKAVDDIRSIFGLLRMQYTKTQDAILTIRRNALAYSAEAYASLSRENLDIIQSTHSQFQGYDRTVKERIQEMSDAEIDPDTLSPERQMDLSSLREISGYLSQVLGHYQRILDAHYEVRRVLDEQLMRSTELPGIRRFSLRRDLFDPLLQSSGAVSRLNSFLYPLFYKPPFKSLNPGFASVPQQLQAEDEAPDEGEFLNLDSGAWAEEQRQQREARRENAIASFSLIIELTLETGSVTLSEIAARLRETPSLQAVLIPGLSIFKALMVSLLELSEINPDRLRREKGTIQSADTGEFHIGEIILSSINRHPAWQSVRLLTFEKLTGSPPALFENALDDEGNSRKILCSDVLISALI